QLAQALGRYIHADRPDQERDHDSDREKRLEDPPWRHSGGVHDDEFGIGTELVEGKADRNHERDRRDQQYQQGDDQAGGAYEDEDGLSTIGDQVDIAQSLRHPHQHGDAGENDQEGTQGGAKDVTPD